MTPVVLDAWAGVELALKTPVGRRLDAQMPGDATVWVPEHFYANWSDVSEQLNAGIRRIIEGGENVRAVLDELHGRIETAARQKGAQYPPTS